MAESVFSDVVPGREAGLEEKPSGGRLPVEHLTCGENSRERGEHQVRGERVPGDTTRRRDRLVERTGAGEGERAGFDVAGGFAPTDTASIRQVAIPWPPL